VVRTTGEDEERVQTIMQDEPGVVWFLYAVHLHREAQIEIFLTRCGGFL